MLAKRLYILLFLLLTGTILFGQTKNRYMVFFKDKNGTPYTINNPIEYLSEKAVIRRMQQGLWVNEQDIPVNTDYIEGVRETGAEVFFRTRWMNGVLVQCTADLIPAIEALSFVGRVEFVAPNPKLVSNGRRKVNQKAAGTKSTEVTDSQLKMIGIDRMHSDDAGYKGEGITIAILDAGFEGVDMSTPFQHLFDQSRINIEVSKDFVYNSDNVFQYDDHGTEVFSVIAAFQPGLFTGGAYEANFQLYVTEEVPTEYRVEEYNWLFAAEHADSAGADIISSSLGYYDFDLNAMNYTKAQMDGKTTVVSRAAQLAANRGIVVVVSAGNEGTNMWQIITAPADAEDVLAVASVNVNQIRSASSSIGPATDGRIKPDVAALGVGTSVIKKNGSTGTSSGTSLATPLITSLAAGIWQRYPNLTNKELMDVIRKTSSQHKNPDIFLGYGIPHYSSVINYIEHQLNPQQALFEVYPNPFPLNVDTLTVRPKNPDEVTQCKIELLSAQGRSVFIAEANFSWLTPKFEANLSHLSEGVYFMRITWEGATFTYKLVKI